MPSNQWLGFGGGVSSQCAVRGNLASGSGASPVRWLTLWYWRPRLFWRRRPLWRRLRLSEEWRSTIWRKSFWSAQVGSGTPADEEGTRGKRRSAGSGGALRVPLHNRRGCEGRRASVRAPVVRVSRRSTLWPSARRGVRWGYPLPLAGVRGS